MENELIPPTPPSIPPLNRGYGGGGAQSPAIGILVHLKLNLWNEIGFIGYCLELHGKQEGQQFKLNTAKSERALNPYKILHCEPKIIEYWEIIFFNNNNNNNNNITIILF